MKNRPTIRPAWGARFETLAPTSASSPASRGATKVASTASVAGPTAILSRRNIRRIYPGTAPKCKRLLRGVDVQVGVVETDLGHDKVVEACPVLLRSMA